jgi:hypothetical protein
MLDRMPGVERKILRALAKRLLASEPASDIH